MAAYADIVYTRALSGTITNPGLPDILSQLVVGQSQHETGNYTSNVFQNSNNGFGYKYSGSRYQVGNYSGYAVYNSIDDSTAELVDWIYRRVRDGQFPGDLSTITSADDYAAYLKAAGYYEDAQSNYASGIEYYFENNILQPLEQNPWLAVAVLGGLVGVALIIGSQNKKHKKAA